MRTFQQVDLPIKTNAEYAEIDVNGQFASVAIEIVGTFSGFLVVKGLTTGAATPTLFLEDVNGGGQAAGPNQITAAGLYRCAAAALQRVRVVPDATFASTGGILVNFSASETLPPVAIIGVN